MAYPIRWTSEILDELKALYTSGLSMQQTADRMGVSLQSVISSMRRHDISRRPSHITKKIKFYHSPLSFKSKTNLTHEEEQLKVAGLMLYWGEGAKKNSTVDFANSDPLMIRVFIKFLRNTYKVNEDKLRILLYCFPSHDINKLVKFWSRITQVPTTQFSKPYIRHNGRAIHDKMKHGLVHVRYSDKRLLELILKEIKQLAGVVE